MDSNGEKNTSHLLNYDVFFGRGRMVSKLPGNIKYKELLYANHKAYNLSQSRYERDMIAETIVSTLKQLGTTFWYVPVKTKGSSRGDHFITGAMRSRGGKEEEDNEKKITSSAAEYQHAAAGKAATLPYASYCSCSSSSSPRRVTHDDKIKKNNNGSTSIKRRMMPPSHQERHHDAEVLPLHDSEFHNGGEQQPRTRPRTKKQHQQQQQQNPAPSFPLLVLVSSPEDSYSRSPTTSKEEQEVYYGWEELKPRGKVLRKVKQVRTSSFCMSETFMHCAFVLL